MTYPRNFEQKTGFDEIRQLLRQHCLSTLGKEEVDKMEFSADTDNINRRMDELREFRRIEEGNDEFPLANVFDLRESLMRVRLQGTHMEVEELFDLKRSLETIILVVNFLAAGEQQDNGEMKRDFPALFALTEGVATFPQIVRQTDKIIDKFGNMRDTASPELLRIRHELKRAKGSISRTLHSILLSAQSEGVVEKDVAPTLRDGRLVIPVVPGLKRKIPGIVHDESATGKTVYVEPTEVVEANNKVRELENAERREMVRILVEFAAMVRPHADELLHSYQFLARIDFIRAKAELALSFKAFEPEVLPQPHIDWINAVHPLLQRSLAKKTAPHTDDTGKEEKPTTMVPLNIQLTGDRRILIISGPNAGGKSVCLKTVGLLQYMLQCGLAIPIGERSTVGTFDKIMIDIGDEQSIENDLSTYSSHLLNMKNMMRHADRRTLILIDEFGTGTEPQMGAAIAEAVLKRFWQQKAWAVITTHYRNLKHFADEHPGVANGAMLYDRHKMQPLFQLAIGRPGSSFAIEIARKTGLPEEVISDAAQIAGSEYIRSDKYLQDIVRDKRYWESKRQTIHGKEKELEKAIARYQRELEEIDDSRKQILNRAKERAEELFKESNRKIENVIREIKEQQAEKEATKQLRQQLSAYENDILSGEIGQNVPKSDRQTPNKKQSMREGGLLTDEEFEKKMEAMKNRKLRHEQHQKDKNERKQATAKSLRAAIQKLNDDKAFRDGDSVRVKGLTTVGKIESMEGKQATIIFGSMRTKMPLARIEHAEPASKSDAAPDIWAYSYSRQTRETIDSHRNQFKQELDLRGVRGEEAVRQVQYFIDDAILVGVSQVRILHGKGNGILRNLIREYLRTVPNVRDFRDEHVQFGGAGITVVEL